MTIRIAINGLGRIGRCVLRAYCEAPERWKDIEIMGLNGPAAAETHVHLLKYDSIHGPFHGTIETGDNALIINGKSIPLLHERDPANLPWAELGVDIVLECTGKFRKKAEAQRHLEAGAKKVLVSAPSPDADRTLVYGVNNATLTPEDTIISVGSCTTNGLAPVAKVLHDALEIEAGFMTTIHAYTGDQNLVDGSHKDLRRARAAALSMIPTSTGAAKALGLVIPELQGKLDGTAIRVPTPNVSLVDLTCHVRESATADAVNDLMRGAAGGHLKGVLGICDAPLVSCDFVRSPYSSVFDTTQTQTVGKHMVRVGAWYDNEWGFSCRMLDVAVLAGNG